MLQLVEVADESNVLEGLGHRDIHTESLHQYR